MPAAPVLEIIDPGLLLSVQDAGRPGLAREGVPRGGAGDRWSLAVANALVGNRPDDAALEATLTGPTVRALASVTVGIAGTMAGRILETGARVDPGMSVSLRPGETLVLDPASGGARGYLAVPGGIDVPVVLGSRSTSLGGGFGGHEGRALRAGDVVRAGPRSATTNRHTDASAPPPARWPGLAAPPAVTPGSPVRLLPGPHGNGLPGSLDALVAAAWSVSAASDRQGLRLVGPALPGDPTGELASHGILPGSIQLPPDRHPIVLLADTQPTGGYPVPAVVITADLPRLGQLAPGAAVQFAVATAQEARAALADADRAFAEALVELREAGRWDDLWRGAGA
ncbi:MAG TPA: biotin-dependent carboxyltransferase family protein [Candidatus Limnocylindrales bacterium]|nr:biotin-dependent carboxyltransferase family protein [Candidatus Limnocylindrales bacterium]